MSTRPKKLVCAALFGAALTLMAGPLQHPAVARADVNQEFYSFCINNLGQGNDYCCAHAGGAVKAGGCVDPATGKAVSAAAWVRVNAPRSRGSWPC